MALGQALTIADDRLLQDAKAGDLAAFEQVVRLHERLVLGVALRLLGQREDAEDAAQEVFIRLYKYLGRFDQAREFTPWLYRMTVNVCRDMGGRRRADAAIVDDTADTASGPDQQARSAEEGRILRAALRKLPERERTAVVLRDLEGLSTSEVAGILGIAEATVRSHLSNGRLRILKLTERYRRERS